MFLSHLFAIFLIIQLIHFTFELFSERVNDMQAYYVYFPFCNNFHFVSLLTGSQISVTKFIFLCKLYELFNYYIYLSEIMSSIILCTLSQL